MTKVLPLSQFSIDKFLSSWLQYASSPQWYEPKGAYNVMAIYLKQDDGSISVTNSLLSKGQVQTIQGQLLPTEDPLVFKVKLEKAILNLFPITADYIIKSILTDEKGNYQYAIVGSKGKTVYLLSRVQHPPCNDQNLLLEEAIRLGYDVSQLQFTAQVCENQSILLNSA